MIGLAKQLLDYGRTDDPNELLADPLEEYASFSHLPLLIFGY